MKRILLPLFFLIFMLSIISAVDFDMKSDYSQGETMILKFSANFIDSITTDNIRFYRGYVRTSIEPHLAKINDEYYIYAQLPENPANYSLRLENVRYLEGSSVMDEDVVQNFTINENKADFLVGPGFIITEEDFWLQMQNLNSKKITINLKIKTETGDEGNYSSFIFGEFEESDEKSFSLITGEIKKVNLKVNGVEEDSFKEIILSSDNTVYRIPFYVIATPRVVDKEEDLSNETETSVSNISEENITFNFKEIQVKIPLGEELVRIFKLQNVGQEKLENIKITLSNNLRPYVEVPITDIISIDVGESSEIGLYFAESIEEKVIEGQLNAKLESGINTSLKITVIYLQNYEFTESEKELSVIKNCSEMGGKFCNHDEECSEELVHAKDGLCCKGNCIKQETTSWSWLGWILLIIIILFVLWFFFKKYLNVKGETKLPFMNKK
jgi:hypothetical protein